MKRKYFFKEKKEKKEEVNAGMGRIMRLNAPEWYLIALGLIGSIVNGGLMPAFAVIFAEILGVSMLMILVRCKYVCFCDQCRPCFACKAMLSDNGLHSM